MKYSRKLILVVFLLSPVIADAFPPAPHHTFFGMVRDELGRPLNGEKVEVLFEASTGRVVRTGVGLTGDPGTNYRLKVPMDSGSTVDLYHPSAMRFEMPYKIRVKVENRIYLPIEMIGNLSKMGQPGKETLLNLTLGEDSDGDGLPDAWERALLSQGKSLSDINPDGDADGDGMSNLDEYISGNYAFDKNDGLRLDIVNKDESGVTLEFLGIQGRTYSINGSSNLKEWNELSFQIEGEDDKFDFVRANKVRKYKVTIPRTESTVQSKFFKLLVR